MTGNKGHSSTLDMRDQSTSTMASEYAASREDFELFRRFLRVARLLDANNFDELCSYFEPPVS